MKIKTSQKITPFLWFEDNALDAAKFYVSIFKNSKIVQVIKCPDVKIPHRPKDSVLTVAFKLDGQKFVALNGGPAFKFNESVSFVVNCASQREVDHYWNKLSKGGQKRNCGWLVDKFGMVWQITPTILIEMISDKNPVKAKQAMESMMTMDKINIAKLKKAVRG